MSALDRVKEHALRLKRDAYTLYFVARDHRTPWFARIVAAAVVAYALSPFDLIPDFVPVLGYLDDLIVVPLGVALVLKLVPTEVLADGRARAQTAVERPTSRAGAAFMICVWLGLVAMVVLLVRGWFD